MYDISLDFHDNALPHTRRVQDGTELALYLERVPSMVGLGITGAVTINVEAVKADDDHPALFTH